MRILFIAPRFHTNQLHLVHKLIEEGHIVDFFTIGKGISEDYTDVMPKQIPISKITKLYIKKNMDFAKYANIAFPNIFKFWAMVNNFKPDVIILRGATSPVYSKVLIPFALIKKIKIVFYTQGPKYVKSLKLLRKVHDYFFSYILNIKWFTPVLYKGKDMIGLKNLSYITYIPFFISPQLSVNEKKEIQGRINFLCIAKYEPRKNIKLLIEVFANISKKYSNFKLTIIGTTGSKSRDDFFYKIKEMVSYLKLDNDIFLYKNIPYGEMKHYYQSSHVMILPSINEPASISQLEAMSYGLAIICTADNGTAHYICHKRNGFIIEPNFVNIYQTIVYYLENPDEAYIHGVESLNLLNQNFEISDNYKKLITLLQN